MSIDLEEQREHELAVEEARKLGLENDPEVSKYLCTGKAKVANVRATIESMAAHGLTDITILQSGDNMETTPKHEFVYAVFLDVHNVLTPYTEEIMTLVVSRENGQEKYRNIDSSTPFYAGYQKEAFTTGVHLNQGPGRMWLFRSQKEAESFRSGLISYAIFLGKCLGGDPNEV